MSKEIDIKTIMKADTIGEFMEKCNENFANIARNGGGPEGKEGAKGEPGALGKTGKSIHWINVEDSDSDSDGFTKEEATELLSVLKEEPEDGDVVFFSNGYVGYVKKVKEGSDDESEYIPEIEKLECIIGPKGNKGEKGKDSSGYLEKIGENTLSMSDDFKYLILPHADINSLDTNPPAQTLTILDDGISFIKSDNQQYKNTIGFHDGGNDLTLYSYEGVNIKSNNGVSISKVGEDTKKLNINTDETKCSIGFDGNLSLSTNENGKITISTGSEKVCEFSKTQINLADTILVGSGYVSFKNGENKRTKIYGNEISFTNQTEPSFPKNEDETLSKIGGNCTIYKDGTDDTSSLDINLLNSYQFLSGRTTLTYSFDENISITNTMLWNKIGNVVNVNGTISFYDKGNPAKLLTYGKYISDIFSNFAYEFPITLKGKAYSPISFNNFCIGKSNDGSKTFKQNDLIPGNASFVFYHISPFEGGGNLKIDNTSPIPVDIMKKDDKSFYFNSFFRGISVDILISHIQYSFSYLLYEEDSDSITPSVTVVPADFSSYDSQMNNNFSING